VAAAVDVDVCIVGAGLAGLATADALAGTGLTAQVWEARDRVGGRTLTRQVDGMALDLGAQWIGPAQVRMHDLAQRFDLATFPTWTRGDSVLVDGVDRRTFTGTVPLLGPVQLARMGLALRTMSRIAAQAGPGATGDIAALDRRTIATVLDGPLGDRAGRRVVDTALRVVFGAEPEELSAAWVAGYAAAAGGDLLQLAAVEGGAQQTRLVGGTQAISTSLAAGLDVHLQRPVRRIAQEEDAVTVTAHDGTAIRAAQVVVATPPGLVERIDIQPALPSDRTGLQQRMPMGATAKVFALYDTPFWRADGLCGEAVITDGPVQVTFDVTSHDGTVPALLAFVTGRAAQLAARGDDQSLASAVTAQLVRAFGPAAAAPRQVVVHQWVHERWTAGCPVANLGPGTAEPFASALRTPVGRIHWAGTETSTDWTGYMEGAVASGRRAAQEVLASA
jgi:monoamine oxidase